MPKICRASLQIGAVFFAFSASFAMASSSYFDTKNKVVNCEQPIPHFTLGRNSSPTTQQVEDLCECIWQEVGDDVRKIFETLRATEGQAPEGTTEQDIENIISVFGDSVRTCGGMDL